LASFGQRCAAHPRPHAEEHRSPTSAGASTARVRCDASRSMRATPRGRPHPSRRAHARSTLRKRLRVRAPQDEAEHHGSRSQTHALHRSRDAFLRPGFCTFASLTPNRGWAERRETFGCVRGTRGARHLASKTRVNAFMTRHARRLRGALRPMTRDARLSALHRGGFRLPGPRFSHRHLRRIGYSELLAPRS
jgi:hypothetical protein